MAFHWIYPIIKSKEKYSMLIVRVNLILQSIRWCLRSTQKGLSFSFCSFRWWKWFPWQIYFQGSNFRNFINLLQLSEKKKLHIFVPGWLAGCLGRIQVDVRKVSSIRIKILNDHSTWVQGFIHLEQLVVWMRSMNAESGSHGIHSMAQFNSYSDILFHSTTLDVLV